MGAQQAIPLETPMCQYLWVFLFFWGGGVSSSPLAGNVTLCPRVLELGGNRGLLVSPVSVHACTESLSSILALPLPPVPMDWQLS